MPAIIQKIPAILLYADMGEMVLLDILVFSDSHSGLSFMRACINHVKPDAIVHLGDHYDDGEAIHEEYPHIPIHAVAGNCDRYRAPVSAREMLCYPIGGVMTFMAHGHNYHVKLGTGAFTADARRYGAKLALYGHTHRMDIHQEDDLWVMNPGACGSFGGSAGLVKITDGEIKACSFITAQDLEV